MNRKEFLKSSVLGLAAFGGVGAIAMNGKDKKDNKDIVGFEHLPAKEEKTMKSVLHRAKTRGHANYGWLDTNHTFSFARYYDPERMNFGALRVLNDDYIDGGTGFDTHPHDNMEIISIPIDGALEHKDSMGNTFVIKNDDVQIMSAGTGIFHSEYNYHKNKRSNFLQIWIYPKKRDIEPRYDQKTYKPEDRINKLLTVASPEEDGSVWINQDAYISLAKFEKGKKMKYEIKKKGNGIYAFIIDGKFNISGQDLDKRDGFGVWDVSSIDIEAETDSEVLLLEVPMNIG